MYLINNGFNMNKRKMQIRVINDNKEIKIEACQGQNLLHALQDNNVHVLGLCRGNGTCGKCKIKVISGSLPVTEADRRILSEEELKQGIRLACKAHVEELCEENNKEELSIEIVGRLEEDIVVEGALVREERADSCEINQIDKFDLEEAEPKEKWLKNYFIAIDIGTTTIAMALVDEETGNVCDTYASLNHQRKFGADVISRIVAANNGNGEELKSLIEKDLWKGIRELTKSGDRKDTVVCNGVGEDMPHTRNLTRIIISGNTTMVHLLMGYSCETLGKYPFVSEHLEQIECTLRECITFHLNDSKSDNGTGTELDNIYKRYERIPVTILPGISAFVGGDIAAGILNCPGFETEEISLLIDLGTNGEIVLGNKERLLTTSAAAGPAFEGGNICCGTAGIPGSICQVKISNYRAIIKTINEKNPPEGICGTGVVSAIAQLKQNKLIDEQGGLIYPYHEKGYPLWTFENGEKIAIYQKDIREFQMAKSAIRAGIEVLMEEYGCSAKEIANIYLAGGFGKGLSVSDAIETGILPEDFRGRVAAIGNASLKGSILYGMEAFGSKRVSDICRGAETVMLAKVENFKEKYYNYMVI